MKANLTVYDKRKLYEFIIPEPAAFYIQTQMVKAQNQESKPLAPSVFKWNEAEDTELDPKRSG